MTVNHVFKQGDLLPVITDTLTDGAGAPLDLTGATVRFSMALDVDRSVVVAGAASIVGSPAAGNVRYAPVAGDTDRAGTYVAEWKVDYGGGQVVRVPNDGYLIVVVTPRVGS